MAAPGVSFNYFEVSLKDSNTGLWHQLDEKPEWFLKISPLGKVGPYHSCN